MSAHKPSSTASGPPSPKGRLIYRLPRRCAPRKDGLSSSRASFAWRSTIFGQVNAYSEGFAGVSPQWLAVRVRVQGGLIPAYNYWRPDGQNPCTVPQLGFALRTPARSRMNRRLPRRCAPRKDRKRIKEADQANDQPQRVEEKVI